MNTVWSSTEPTRAEVDALAGPTLVEFGNSWCGWCRAAQPLLAAALQDHPRIRHFKIADASGRRLGRSFNVKLWPTFIFIKDGKELSRLVRPKDEQAIRQAISQIDPAAPG